MNKYSPLCQDLTIFILTYNRPEALKRQLESLQHFPGAVTVLDGGFTDLNSLNYFNKPPKFSYIQNPLFSERFSKAGESLNTKYAMTFSDDDLLLANGVNFLMQKITTGNTDSIFGRMLYAYPLKTSWGFRLWKPSYSTLKDRTILGRDSPRRAIEHFTNYVTSYFYSIMKEHTWRDTFARLKLPNEDMKINPYALELAYEFLGAIAGTIEIIPILCGIRVKDQKPTWLENKNEFGNLISMTTWLSNSESGKAVDSYKHAILDACCKPKNSADTKRALDKALLQFTLLEQHAGLIRNKPSVHYGKKKRFTTSNLLILLEQLLLNFKLSKILVCVKTKKILRELDLESINYEIVDVQLAVKLLYDKF